MDIEILKFIGSAFGYILSAITLITLIVKSVKNKAGNFIRKASGSKRNKNKIDDLEKLINRQIEESKNFHTLLMEMLEKQAKASKQILANVIESTYHEKKHVKQLDELELKRIINSYAIYHNEFNGNSYITEIYNEMIEHWEHL